MPTRQERLAALLAQPEREVRARHHISGLLEETSFAALADQVDTIISTQAAGDALRQARHQRELSLKGAGEASGRSAPRIKAIEETGTDIHLGTVVSHAQALGYRVQLTLTPIDHQAAVIRADLGLDTDVPANSSQTTWSSEVVLPSVQRKKALKAK